MRTAAYVYTGWHPIAERLLQMVCSGVVLQLDDTPVMCQAGRGEPNFAAPANQIAPTLGHCTVGPWVIQPWWGTAPIQDTSMPYLPRGSPLDPPGCATARPFD